MTLQDYLSLKNGTDVRGVATEGVEGEGITLTSEGAANIAKAFCVWLRSYAKKKKVCVAVGYDSRISSPTLCEGIVEGILSLGHSVVVTGLSTTPSMYQYLLDSHADRRCQGAIMITASHLPFNRNGMKFFTVDGGLSGENVKEILTLAAEHPFKKKRKGKRLDAPYLDRYADSLVEMVRKATEQDIPLRGKKIVVDAGNGVGGFFVDKVLEPLGANTIGSRFLDPDGHFPNHIPNPENKEAMRSISEAVKAVNADFGIIFDTDVDRAGAVDKNGEEINRNRLIALLSAILLEEKTGTIVTDSVTSDGLTKFIEGKGGKHHRFKRGYKNVIDEAVRLNAKGEYSPLAMETSGHAAMMENHFLDDGAYLIARLLIAMAKLSKEGKALTDLIADLQMPVEELEFRLHFKEGCDYIALGDKLIKEFTAYANSLSFASVPSENYEGCRLSYDKEHGEGWALLRMSLHEPILPINVESDRVYGGFKIVKDLYYFLKGYDFLDVTLLTNTIDKYRASLLEEVKQATSENKLKFLF